MAIAEKTVELKGKSGKLYRFFPQFPLAENMDSKGAGMYVFTGDKGEVADIQFLLDDDEISATLQRMKDDGITAFYFRDENDEAVADTMIDDIKSGDDYRRKSD